MGLSCDDLILDKMLEATLCSGALSQSKMRKS